MKFTKLVFILVLLLAVFNGQAQTVSNVPVQINVTAATLTGVGTNLYSANAGLLGKVVPLLGGRNILTGSNTLTSTLLFSNAVAIANAYAFLDNSGVLHIGKGADANVFQLTSSGISSDGTITGTHVGDGSGITGILAGNITAGTLGYSRLPAGIGVTNGFIGPVQALQAAQDATNGVAAGLAAGNFALGVNSIPDNSITSNKVDAAFRSMLGTGGSGGGGLIGSGSPENVVAAAAGSLYYDSTGRGYYTKTNGTGNTGWSLYLVIR